MKIGNVLSVFDGMGCAKLALDRAGITYNNYYASEIDSHAIKQTKAKYGDVIHLGDVTKVKASELPPIDIILGGSPCQGFSFAGKGLNFEDPRSKLFFEFVRLLKECKEKNPAVKFLLENVRMKKEHENVISELLDIQPILINSALVCAQNRERLYWTNIATIQEGLFGHTKCSIPQPKDTGVLLRDILQDNVDDKYYISEKALARMLRKAYSQPKVNPSYPGSLNTKNNSGQLSMDSGTTLVTPMGHAGDLMIYNSDKCPSLKVGGHDDINIAFEDRSKAPCLTVGGNGAGNNSDSELLVFGVLNDNGELRETGDKSTCIDANYFKGVDSHAQRNMIQTARGFNQGGEVGKDGKSTTLTGNSWEHNNHLVEKKCIRQVGGLLENPKDRVKKGPKAQMFEERLDEKTGTLSTVQKDNMVLERLLTIKSGEGMAGRVFSIDRKSISLKASDGGLGVATGLYVTPQRREINQLNPSTESGGIQPYQQNRIYDSDGIRPSLLAEMSSGTHAVLHNSRIRRLTPIECCRLQTVPETKEVLIFNLCLDQVKNFVAVVNQSPKLQKFVLNALDQEQNTFVSTVIKNFFTSLPQKENIVLQNANTQPLLESQKTISTCQSEQNLIVNNAGNTVMYKPQGQEQDFVDLNVFIDITAGNKITLGKGELPLNEKPSVNLKSGNWQLDKFGQEINHLVSDVGENINSPNRHSMSTTLSHLSIKSIAQMSAILFYFAENAIDTFTQSATLPKNLSLRFSLSNNYFFNADGGKIVSESQMYKMLGNGWTIDVIVHILKHWKQ